MVKIMEATRPVIYLYSLQSMIIPEHESRYFAMCQPHFLALQVLSLVPVCQPHSLVFQVQTVQSSIVYVQEIFSILLGAVGNYIVTLLDFLFFYFIIF